MTWKRSLAALLLIIMLVWNIPRFLIYSESPEPSDAIVYFLGSPYKDREDQVRRLVDEKIADTILVPARGLAIQSSDLPESGSIARLHGEKVIPPPVRKQRSRLQRREGTHLEVIAARAMMERMAISSAVFVSSPYHMRRIKLMTWWEFRNSNCRIRFVAAEDDAVTPARWLFNEDDRQWVKNECLKILWFLVYASYHRLSQT